MSNYNRVKLKKKIIFLIEVLILKIWKWIIVDEYGEDDCGGRRNL